MSGGAPVVSLHTTPANHHHSAPSLPITMTTRAASRAIMARLSAVATEKVLNVGELLELILGQLEPADLTTSLKVCKTWRDAIIDSVKLHPLALPWNNPITKAEYLVWIREDDLKRRAPNRQTSLFQPRLSREYSPSGFRIGRFNPVLHSALKNDYKTATRIEINLDKILAWKGDFWRKQQIIQPPFLLGDPRSRFTRVFSSFGTTLGDLYDAVSRGSIKSYGCGGKIATVDLDMFMAEDNVDVQEARRFAAEEVIETVAVVAEDDSTDMELSI